MYADRGFHFCRQVLLVGIVICSVPVMAATPEQPVSLETAVVRIAPRSDLGPVNRQVLGNNVLGYLHSNADYSAKGAGVWDPASRSAVAAVTELAKGAGVSSLRWPGGCDAHLFNWKLTVGPLETRPKQAFGLAEFLAVARDIGAEPVITVSEYSGSENDAADLVEYLNAPVGRNANGGIDWAAVRAAQGHPEPYGVKWFEFGNESDHGPHALGVAPKDRGTAMTPDEYATRFRMTVAAMKAIDPSVHVGAVLSAETAFPLSAWSETVILKAGDVADFLIYHAYLPRTTDNSGATSANDLFDVAFISSEQLAVFFGRLREETKRLTGHSIPLGITEFNGLFQQEQPKPYRLSLGAAVLVADMVTTFLKPDSGVEFANYWQLSNEYWGMVRGYGLPYVKRPAYYLFQLFNDHLGDRLVSVGVTSKGYQSQGGFGVLATGNVPSRFEMRKTETVATPWKTSFAVGAKASVDKAGVLSVELPSSVDLNYFQAGIPLRAVPGLGYRVTAEIRTEGLSKSGAQLEVSDGRGWTATKSASLSMLVRSRDWTPVTVDYVGLPDTNAIDIKLRRLGGVPEGGKMEARSVKIQSFAPDRLGNVPYVSALATRGGNKLSVFLVNRNVHQAMRVRLEGMPSGTDTAWTLSGPAVDSNNEVRADEVIPRQLALVREFGAVFAVLPPHSFSVVSSFDSAK
jgi:alpha-N-arabinofuranosidase